MSQGTCPLDSSTENEYLSRFYRKDRLKPVITLVIYFGDALWDGPRSLSDMMEESPFKKYAVDYPMHLLDVRHMTKEQLDEFSPVLKAFFGYLVYENSDKLTEFVEENKSVFSDFPEQAIDALIEITHSELLEKYKKDNKTSGGGVSVVDGFQIYALQEKKKIYVEAAQEFGKTLTDTIAAFITKFQVRDAKEAEEEVKKYWKNVNGDGSH